MTLGLIVFSAIISSIGLFLTADACGRDNGIHCLIESDRRSPTDRIWNCDKCGPFYNETCTEDRYVWETSRVFGAEARCETHCCMCKRFDGKFTPCRATHDIRDDVLLFVNPNPFSFAPCGWCPAPNPSRKLTCHRQGCFTNATLADGTFFTLPPAQNACANGPCDAIIRLKKF